MSLCGSQRDVRPSMIIIKPEGDEDKVSLFTSSCIPDARDHTIERTDLIRNATPYKNYAQQRPRCLSIKQTVETVLRIISPH